ncbi:MAG: hypothetical protein IGS38_21210 [Synechococcales cyanobacterium M58_A2018_015]|nr:hypothetical protein [Synechococcales cyanobacterium M58_A2018_015]
MMQRYLAAIVSVALLCRFSLPSVPAVLPLFIVSRTECLCHACHLQC